MAVHFEMFSLVLSQTKKCISLEKNSLLDSKTMLKCLSYINCFCNKIKLFLIKRCHKMFSSHTKGIIWYLTERQMLVFSKMYS